MISTLKFISLMWNRWKTLFCHSELLKFCFIFNTLALIIEKKTVLFVFSCLLLKIKLKIYHIIQHQNCKVGGKLVTSNTTGSTWQLIMKIGTIEKTIQIKVVQYLSCVHDIPLKRWVLIYPFCKRCFTFLNSHREESSGIEVAISRFNNVKMLKRKKLQKLLHLTVSITWFPYFKRSYWLVN